MFFFRIFAPIFYNFPNLIIFEFVKLFSSNKFSEYFEFVNKKKLNYENLIIFEMVKILEVFLLLSNLKIKKYWKLRRFSKNWQVLEFRQFSYFSFDINLFRSFIDFNFHLIFYLLSFYLLWDVSHSNILLFEILTLLRFYIKKGLFNKYWLTATLPSKWPHCHCQTDRIASRPESTTRT